MTHPFEHIPSARRGVVLLALGAATVALLGVLGSFYGPLQNAAAPQGMVSLELAWTPERVSQMLASWSEETRMGLAFSLGLNFLCLFALTNTLALGCVWAAERVRSGLPAGAGALLAWGQWLAGAVWAVENSLLAAAIFGHASGASMAAASALSVVKFALTGAGLLFAVGAGAYAAASRPAGGARRPKAQAASRSKS